VFYPLLRVLELDGWVDLFNFAPNDWEGHREQDAYVSVLHPAASGEAWFASTRWRLAPGERCRVTTAEIEPEALQTGMALLFPSREPLPGILSNLPAERIWVSSTPAWRSTVGLRNAMSRVSYQGELEPFPKSGSLLSFHPFIQFNGMDNYLLALNVQSTPELTQARLEIHDSRTRKLVDVQPIFRNSATVIPLDRYGFGPDDLPVFVCREISAVPFGLGIAHDRSMMSLEHTHPPASFFLHGERWKQQALTKQAWFSQLEEPA